jgi:tetratricopeptide (TPR) repeat protein
MIKKIFLLSAIFCGTLSGVAQTKTEGDYIRSGNKFYADSLYEKAEIEYRKALEINPKSTDAMYNLGNALFNQIPQSQEKGKEAMEQYATAAKLESDKAKLAHINHNLGTLLYMAQQYPQSVEAYKESLRNNPNDNETRYNLAKAMYMLKQQQDQQQEQQQDQQQEQQQDQQQEQQQNQQQEQQQEQQQQDQQEQQQNQEQQQSQQDEEQISKENAEQILNALMQDEKDIQEKQKKMMQQHQGKTLDKDW